jgi:uncharacterized cupin superfamily protein
MVERHWHTESDESVYVISGEVVLVSEDGDEVLRAGDVAGFKAGDTNGHCLQNRSTTDAYLSEIGTRSPTDVGYYSDIDMVAPAQGDPAIYARRDGIPYEDVARGGHEGIALCRLQGHF